MYPQYLELQKVESLSLTECFSVILTPMCFAVIVFIPISKKAMPKNVQPTVQVCSFCTLVTLWSNSFKLGFSSTEPKTSRRTSWV